VVFILSAEESGIGSLSDLVKIRGKKDSMRQYLRCAAVSLALAGAIAAQTTAPSTVQTFSSESGLALNSFSATATANFNPTVMSAIQAGALELRQSIQWEAAAVAPPGTTPVGRLMVRLFTVQPNAPLPTPETVNIGNALVSTYVINVDKVYVGSAPSSSVMFVGTVASNSLPDPYGNLTGAPAAVSVGYSTGATGGGTTGGTTTTPATLNNAVVLIAGRVVSYAATVGGTVTFPDSGGPGGGTPPPSGAPVVVIKDIGATNFSIVRLDASGSTNPAGGTLTYRWRVVSGAGSISDPNAAATDAYLLGLDTQYVFEVMVTNSAGQSTTRQVTVQKF
jgi:hypothetical protein